MKYLKGFSLMELMFAVAIIGVIAAVALPSYQISIRKGRRADAQQAMMDLAQRNQQWFLDNRSYTSSVNTLATPPTSVTNYYTLSIVLADGPPPTFTVRAVPTGSQSSDTCGTLELTSANSKSPANCW